MEGIIHPVRYGKKNIKKEDTKDMMFCVDTSLENPSKKKEEKIIVYKGVNKGNYRTGKKLSD